ncbi:MAG: class I SAM-dependent methyltransferase [Proteobacteria bacterium]|nr:class I SAM-dependent methyltransferase [Pseudomonadota bacterium]
MIEALLESVAAKVIRRGNLEVEFPSGRRAVFGDQSGERVSVLFRDKAAIARLLLRPTLAFGELLSDDRLTVLHGSVYNFIDLVSRNIGTNPLPGFLPIHALRNRALTWLQQRNTISRSARNVEHHYDLDRRLYDLFLDADHQYSCAYFEGSDDDLEKAQIAKKRHIAAKLMPEPGHRILDVGSGWGGMALYLARYCRAQVVGVTLSHEQLQISRERALEQGLSDAVEFRLEDYRNVDGRFDRIVSIGMFEHVGLRDYTEFFSQSRRLLDDDGVMLLHTIGRSDAPSPTNPWIEKYIFPGSYAPALSEVAPIIERSGFVITDLEILRLHYAKTLRAWRERFLSRWQDVHALYGERFCRMWETYLAACETGFRYGGLVVFQFQLAKRQDAVPLTRAYIERREAEFREAESRVDTDFSQTAAE